MLDEGGADVSLAQGDIEIPLIVPKVDRNSFFVIGNRHLGDFDAFTLLEKLLDLLRLGVQL